MRVKFNLKAVKNLLYILLVFCSSCSEPKPPQVAFDIPVLIGKNIDEVRKVLGKPSSPLANRIEPSNPKEETFENDYEKNDVYISFIFNTKSRRISRITLISTINGYDRLEDVMKIGNLTLEETDSYWLEGRHAILSSDFSGIDIHIK